MERAHGSDKVNQHENDIIIAMNSDIDKAEASRGKVGRSTLRPSAATTASTSTRTPSSASLAAATRCTSVRRRRPPTTTGRWGGRTPVSATRDGSSSGRSSATSHCSTTYRPPPPPSHSPNRHSISTPVSKNNPEMSFSFDAFPATRLWFVLSLSLSLSLSFSLCLSRFNLSILFSFAGGEPISFRLTQADVERDRIPINAIQLDRLIGIQFELIMIGLLEFESSNLQLIVD